VDRHRRAIRHEARLQLLQLEVGSQLAPKAHAARKQPGSAAFPEEKERIPQRFQATPPFPCVLEHGCPFFGADPRPSIKGCRTPALLPFERKLSAERTVRLGSPCSSSSPRVPL